MSLLEFFQRLKATISALDREKDHLQIAVDEKAELVQDMNDKLHVKVRYDKKSSG